MKRTFAFAFAVAAAVILSSAPAYAAENYTPVDPREPSLAGSSVQSQCQRDVPWIGYDVVLTDPDNVATNHTATLVLTDGTNTAELPLGELTDNKLSGRILWPGASVDGSGTPTGWPGWAFTDGAWTETDGNFAWTRGNITARIVVNPQIAVPLSYPLATPECAAAPNVSGQGSGAALAVTGIDAQVLPIALVGGGLLLAGGVFLGTRRLRRR